MEFEIVADTPDECVMNAKEVVLLFPNRETESRALILSGEIKPPNALEAAVTSLDLLKKRLTVAPSHPC